MTPRNLVSNPTPTRDRGPRPNAAKIAQLQRTTAMANSNGTAEVAKTPTKEQNVDGQADGAEEEGANGQMPDSMCH